MITGTDLWTVTYTEAGIAAAAAAIGAVALRAVAGRAAPARVTVVAAVTVAATLAGVAVISMEMLISREDVNVVLTAVVIAGIAGFIVALVLGRRESAASRLLLAAVQDAGRGGGYRPPRAVLPAELAALSAELQTTHGLLAAARDRERALEASRRELVAWVSHDLRAPLAGLQAMAEALEDGVVTDEQTISRYHAQIRAEAGRLTLMVDDLFELSRIHAGALRLSRQVVGLGDLIGETLTSAEPLAQAKGVRLHGPPVSGLPVCVDTTEVGRALRNLVVNAIRHTPSDGAVEVLADQQSGMAVVSVSDSCGGIPAEHLPRVFDVAFRGDTARTHGPGEGAGLGLSIARGIIEAHAGQIAVRNAGTGCQFVIQLPLAPAAANGSSAANRSGGTNGSAAANRPGGANGSGEANRPDAENGSRRANGPAGNEPAAPNGHGNGRSATAEAGLANAHAQPWPARGFPQRGPGEAGHAVAESGLRREAELSLRKRG
jgi:signal transduction histidine kinase